MTPPNDRKWRGTKEPLYYSEGREWKFSLKLNIQKVKNLAPGPITSWQIDGEKVETMKDFIFLASKITVDSDSSHEIKMLALWKKSYDKHRKTIKKQRHYFANKDLYSQSCDFSSSHVWIWELDCKEGWVPKNWCFQTVVPKALESSLDCKEIKPLNPKGSQPWIFTGGTDAEAEAPILWWPDSKSWLIEKDPDVRKDWRQEEMEMTEDEIVVWHYWLNGHSWSRLREILKNRETWHAAAQGVTKIQAQLSHQTQDAMHTGRNPQL